MKHGVLISRTKQGSRRRLLQQVFGLTLAVLLLAGCGGAPVGQQGEVVGITAQVPFEAVQSGVIRNVSYVGTIKVRLPDEGVVSANCSEELWSDIQEALEFSEGQFTFSITETVFISGGFVSTITINLEEPQNVLLVRNEADKWEVAEVLK
ncbi:MAG: hypothetical protein WBB65_09245 [Anaerolineales bacterium]